MIDDNVVAQICAEIKGHADVDAAIGGGFNHAAVADDVLAILSRSMRGEAGWALGYRQAVKDSIARLEDHLDEMEAGVIPIEATIPDPASASTALNAVLAMLNQRRRDLERELRSIEEMRVSDDRRSGALLEISSALDKALEIIADHNAGRTPVKPVRYQS
jgi:hypothetical protein